MGRLPNVIIIGAMKCGTSSLHYYLDQHPDVQMSRLKELRFFIEEKNWSRGIDWYRLQFDTGVSIAGESTTGYTAYPFNLGVPERMHRVIPEAKLIFMVRDPIERAVSHYLHQARSGREIRSLQEALASDAYRNPYIVRSKYFYQIQQYLPYYPTERILVLDSRDLRERREATIAGVFRYLGVDADVEAPGLSRVMGQTRRGRSLTSAGVKLAQAVGPSTPSAVSRVRPMLRRALLLPFYRRAESPTVDDELRARLTEHLSEDAHAFRGWTNRPFSHWTL